MNVLRAIGLRAAFLLAFVMPGGAIAQPALSSAQRLLNVENAVATLTQTVAALQSQVQAQAGTITALQTALTQEIADRKAHADSVGASTLASARTYADGLVAPVADKLVHFSREGNDVRITGANVHIRNGTGHSYFNVNGLGNLIVGYNELRTGTGAVNTRSGSHNIVIGLQNNFSSAGAIVAGSNNNSTNYMASVYGGTGNTASGLYAHISGGYNNVASGAWSNIGGGRDKVASAQLANLP